METQMSENKLEPSMFNETPVIKHLFESKSEPPPQPQEKPKRGRKVKYNTEEERREARKRYQREYRMRKKAELERLRELARSIEAQKLIAIENDDGSEHEK